MPSCQDCRFFNPISGYSKGDCRAHPPVVLQTPNGTLSYTPKTPADGWCGEHEPYGPGDEFGISDAIPIAEVKSVRDV